MSEQKILSANNNYAELDDYLSEISVKKIMLVCDGSLQFLKIKEYFDTLTKRTGIEVVKFSDFQPNPLYESVVDGVKQFKSAECDAIIAVGGGSAMDVAKCVKLYSNMDASENYLEQTIISNDIPFLAVPTTAGTGSEATQYAVIYYNGEKQSVADCSCIPETVLMDASVLKTLPEYQKKATMMDALCHAIESFWSVNSTDESKEYSKAAIKIVIANKDAYLANDEQGNANMLKAANLAGKAINITQTTAGHAMCYKLTSLYGIAHGHAAALCVAKLFPFMIANPDRCIDSRGQAYLESVFTEIATAMSCDTAEQTVEAFSEIVRSLELSVPQAKAEDFAVLRKSVNLVRLKNHPISLDEEIIDSLYHMILQ